MKSVCKTAILLITISLVISLLYANLLCCSEPDRDESKWERIKNEDGIRIFCRELKDLEFKEFKGITQIKTSLASLIALMNDTSAYTSWLHFCDEATLIGQISKAERYLYLVYNVSSVPGVKDSDMIVHSRVFQNTENGAITIELKGVDPSELPDLYVESDFVRKSGVKRVKELRGSWIFTPVENGYAKVIYQLYLDPAPGRFTKGRVNPTIEESVYQTLKNMKKIVANAKYKEADPDIIKEIPEQKSQP